MTEYGATLVNGITNGFTYGVLGATFALIFFVSGRFHFAFGLFYGLAGVLTAWGIQVQGWAPIPAIVAGVVAATVGGVLCEVIVYRAFDRRAPGSACSASSSPRSGSPSPVRPRCSWSSTTRRPTTST